MRAIILGAGSGSRLGGYNKLLIKDKTGCTILERITLDLMRIGIRDITIVVGYKAINVMSKYPAAKYVINPIFDVTNSAYSTALAFQEDNSPAILVYGENIYPRGNPFENMNQEANLMLTSTQTKTDKNATGPICNVGGEVVGVREGLGVFPESIGIFTFWDTELINEIVKWGLLMKKAYMGIALDKALKELPDIKMRVVNYLYRKFEFDTPQDYLDYLNSNEI